MPSRRRFVRDALLIMAAPSLSPIVRAWRQGGVVLDARRFGARGDGATDDTAALQSAVAALPAAGGTVLVPRGEYLVNATVSLRLRSGMTLRLARGAVLRAIPNAVPVSAVISGRNLTDVHVLGGRIVGERQAHRGTAGEWGMGIELRGCTGASVRRVTVEECWGDGIYVGSSPPSPAAGGECRDVTVADCTLRHNRRQGISLTGCLGGRVERCHITDTGGTEPQSGIDLEPNPNNRVEDVVVVGNRLERNAGFGIQVVGDNGVARVRIEDNVTRAGGRGGVMIRSASRIEVVHNTLGDGALPGVRVEGSSGDIRIERNVCTNGWLELAPSIPGLRVAANSCGAGPARP